MRLSNPVAPRDALVEALEARVRDLEARVARLEADRGPGAVLDAVAAEGAARGRWGVDAEPGAARGRWGVDAQPGACAAVGLDGRFLALNAAFEALVGYGEEEFRRARWPSVHDRKAYELQLEQLAELARGELETLPVRSSYMHALGALVVLQGELRLVRDEASGRPSHLLLTVQRRASR